jgi:signal transduction histidine kinase
MVELEDGSIVVTTASGGLFRLDSDDSLHELAQLGHPVVAIATAPDGDLYLGGAGCFWHWRGGAAERIDVAFGDVRALLPRRGTLLGDGAWIGTYGGGLAWFDGTRLLGTAGHLALPDRSLNSVLLDGRGRLWVQSNRGLSVVDEGEVMGRLVKERDGVEPAAWAEPLVPVTLTPSMGVPEANGGRPAWTRDERGRTWFATIDGVAGLTLEAFPQRERGPTVHLTSLAADGRRLHPVGPVSLPAGTRRVTVGFTTFALSMPELARFEVELEGFDPGPRDVGSDRVVEYTSLRPGEYRLLVRARDELGVWSAEPTVLTLRMPPLWWERSDSRLALAVLFVALLVVLHRARVASVRRRGQALLDALAGRARAEERESRLRDELAHVARVATAGELASSLAHEVNQPLATVMLQASNALSLLERSPRDEGALASMMHDITRQTERAAEVIRRLRSFMRGQAAERRPVDLDEVVRTTMPLLRRELADHGVREVLVLHGNLKPTLADPVQLQQVLVNVIKNACEAMENWRGPRWVRITTSERGDEITLSIRDSGPGPDPSLQRNILDPYVTTKPSGMGLGLSISRTIVEAHGGSLTAHHAHGGGFEVVLTLPNSPRTGPTGRNSEHDRGAEPPAP